MACHIKIQHNVILQTRKSGADRGEGKRKTTRSERNERKASGVRVQKTATLELRPTTRSKTSWHRPMMVISCRVINEEENTM